MMILRRIHHSLHRLMSRVRCSVCDRKFATLKHCLCSLCHWSFWLCEKCEIFGRDYVKSPQLRREYCPQCNEKHKDDNMALTNHDGVLIGRFCSLQNP